MSTALFFQLSSTKEWIACDAKSLYYQVTICEANVRFQLKQRDYGSVDYSFDTLSIAGAKLLTNKFCFYWEYLNIQLAFK